MQMQMQMQKHKEKIGISRGTFLESQVVGWVWWL